eukprot:4454898-Pleurochrysis_carterae.AAC.4
MRSVSMQIMVAAAAPKWSARHMRGGNWNSRLASRERSVRSGGVHFATQPTSPAVKAQAARHGTQIREYS